MESANVFILAFPAPSCGFLHVVNLKLNTLKDLNYVTISERTRAGSAPKIVTVFHSQQWHIAIFSVYGTRQVLSWEIGPGFKLWPYLWLSACFLDKFSSPTWKMRIHILIVSKRVVKKWNNMWNFLKVTSKKYEAACLLGA